MGRRPRLRKIKIDFVLLTDAWGKAYAAEHRIELHKTMDDRLLLEIAAHEVAHVICDYLDEEAIALLGRHIGEVIHRLGFRRTEKGDE